MRISTSRGCAPGQGPFSALTSRSKSGTHHAFRLVGRCDKEPSFSSRASAWDARDFVRACGRGGDLVDRLKVLLRALYSLADAPAHRCTRAFFRQGVAHERHRRFLDGLVQHRVRTPVILACFRRDAPDARTYYACFLQGHYAAEARARPAHKQLDLCTSSSHLTVGAHTCR